MAGGVAFVAFAKEAIMGLLIREVVVQEITQLHLTWPNRRGSPLIFRFIPFLQAKNNPFSLIDA